MKDLELNTKQAILDEKLIMCKECNNKFERIYKVQVFCTPVCRKIYYKRRQKTKCQKCGEPRSLWGKKYCLVCGRKEYRLRHNIESKIYRLNHKDYYRKYMKNYYHLNKIIMSTELDKKIIDKARRLLERSADLELGPDWFLDQIHDLYTKEVKKVIENLNNKLNKEWADIGINEDGIPEYHLCFNDGNMQISKNTRRIDCNNCIINSTDTTE